MATTSDVDKRVRHAYGLRIIRGYLHFLQLLAEQGITIARFYSMGTTVEGCTILKQAAFEERGQLGKRIVLELNPAVSVSRMAQAYSTSLKNLSDNHITRTHIQI